MLYYALLALLLTIVNTTSQVIKHAPTVERVATEVATEINHNVPKDIKLTVSPNGVTSNANFPIIIKSPKALTELPESLLIIDPKGEVGMMQKYNSPMLINNYYMILGNNESVETTSLKDFPEVNVDYPTLKDISQKLAFITKNAYLFTAGFFTINNLLKYFINKLIYVALFALVLKFSFKDTFGNYSKSFTFSAYSTTLPMLIETVLNITGINAPFSGWFTLTQVVSAALLFKFLKLKRYGQETVV